MKNLVIGLFVLGLTSLGFSQNTNSNVEEVKLESVTVTPRNLSYLDKVQDKSMSDHVKFLEDKASVYNVRELPEFDGRKESFKTIFRGTKGYIIATYSNNGMILKTRERYSDIKLPKQLIKSVLSQYPNSDFLKVVYTVDYDHQKDVKKTYKIQIMKDNLIKNLKISSGGNIDKTVTMSIVN
ncbi:MAG TPA: hypothetical protein VGA80_14720 [Flavobacteriaceae bacterium]|jgi:hypothetical protein